jgi:chromosome segregation ATPase
MSDGWYEDAAWDDPIPLSRDGRCNLKRFSTASRNFRDELNNGELHVSSNQDLVAIVRNSRYKHRDWWKYVDPAASRSTGREDLTAIVLWQCENHVLTCRKIRGRWTLLPGYALDDLIDVVNSPQVHSPADRNHEYLTDQSILDDDLDDVISYLIDDEADNSLDDGIAQNVAPIHGDLDEEDTEHSLLKLDRDLEKASDDSQLLQDHNMSAENSDTQPPNNKRINREVKTREIERLEHELETLRNNLHEALDQNALLKHQLRIEKDHNHMLQRANEQTNERLQQLSSTFETAVEERFESERKTLKHQIDHLELKIEDLKKTEDNKDSRGKLLSNEVARLNRAARDQQFEISNLNYTIERLKNELTRAELKLNETFGSIISDELDAVKSDLSQALGRETALKNQLAIQIGNTSQLESRIRELSEDAVTTNEKYLELLEERDNFSDLQKKLQIETTEKINMAIRAERNQKLLELEERDSAHERELSDINSRLHQADHELASLRHQIVESEQLINDLKAEKHLNDLATAKLEEVISLLNERLPEVEVTPETNQLSIPSHNVKKRRRFRKRPE